MSATLIEPSREVEHPDEATEIFDPVMNETALNTTENFSREDLVERANKVSSTLENILRYPIAVRHWGINE